MAPIPSSVVNWLTHGWLWGWSQRQHHHLGPSEQTPCGAAVALRLVPSEAGSGLVPPRCTANVLPREGG